MKNIRKTVLRGASILGLVLSAASTSSASSALNRPSMDPQVMLWKVIARKNFVEGFCVAQNLNAQGIIIQANRQVDQATVNAFKNAVAACKPGSKNTVTAPPAPAPVGAPVSAPNPVAPAPGPSPASITPIVN